MSDDITFHPFDPIPGDAAGRCAECFIGRDHPLHGPKPASSARIPRKGRKAKKRA